MIPPVARRDRMPANGLYAITDGPRDGLLEAARAALEGGATLLQYRDKTREVARRLHEACALAALCREFAVPLIINDDVGLARSSGAAGVHLGADDVDIADARGMLEDRAIIGVSCYDSLRRAHAAAAAGANYLAFGAFFATATKKVTRHATPALLHDAKAIGLPLVAIGGITPDNGRALVDAGADFLAVVSALFGSRDVRAQARRFTALFESSSRNPT